MIPSKFHLIVLCYFPSKAYLDQHHLAVQTLFLHNVFIPVGERFIFDYLQNHSPPSQTSNPKSDTYHTASWATHLGGCFCQIISNYAKHLQFNELTATFDPSENRTDLHCSYKMAEYQLEHTFRLLSEERSRFENTLETWRNPLNVGNDANGSESISSTTLFLLCKRVIGLKWRRPRTVRRFIDFAIECRIDRRLLLKTIDDDCDVKMLETVGENKKSIVMINHQLRRYAVRALLNNSVRELFS